MGGFAGTACHNFPQISRTGASAPEFRAGTISGLRARSLFCPVAPSADLRHPRLVPFRGQAEVEGSLFRKHINQNERSDLELPQDGECLGAWKNAIARLSAFDRRVLVDAEYRSDGKRLTDNPDVPGLEHDNEGERTPRVAPGLPERDGDGAAGSATARAGVAFRDPLVGTKRPSTRRP